MKLEQICKILKSDKKIILLVTFLLISFICLIKRENIVNEPVASNCNSEIELTLDNNHILKQTWQASKKKITGITISTQNGAQLSGEVKLYFSKEATMEEAIAGPLELSLEKNASNELNFSFKNPVEVELGECYNIFLAGNSTEPSILRIDSNDNHYGCFINNTDTYQAAGINIQYIKTSKIFWIYIILVLIFAYAFGFMLFFKKDFADVVGMTIVAIGLIIYLAGILGLLRYGIWLSVIGAFLLILFEGYYIFKNKIKLTDFFSPSVLIWMLLFIIVILHNQNVSRAEWDEFSHWGLTVKDMYFSNSFSNYEGTNTLITIYPPFISIIQYLFMYINDGFSESMLYIAHQLVGLSFMCVLLKNVSFRRLRSAIIGTVIMLIMPLIVFSNFYCTIYVDALLGVISAFVFLCYLTEDLNLFNVTRISMGIFALALTKETGAVLAGILILIICGNIIYKNKKIFSKDMKKIILFFTILLMTFASWQIYLATPLSKAIPDLLNGKNEHLEASVSVAAEKEIPILSNKGIDISEVSNIMKGQMSQEQFQIIKNYITKTFSETLILIGPIGFSVMDILFALLLVSLVIGLKGWIGAKSKIIYRGMWGMLVGGFGYLGFLLLPYLFIFKNPKMFHSYHRYAGSYVLAVLIFFISFIFICLTENRNHTKEKEYKLGIVLIILLIWVPIEGFYMKPVDRISKPDALYGYEEITETFRGFADKSDKVYFVCNGSNGYSNLVFLNAIVPVHTDYPVWDLYTDAGKASTSVKEWEEKLYRDYQYVFILHADYKFKRQYGELFENEDSIIDGSIFKIVKTEEGGFTLRNIANVGVKDYI